MKPLSAHTLRTLLRTYETAIAELQALHDPDVQQLIARMLRHRDEVTAALAASDTS
jgi:hypothetical protein